MSHALPRSVQVAFTSLAALCFACGADQNKMKKTVEEHLDEARSIQAKLAKGSGSTTM